MLITTNKQLKSIAAWARIPYMGISTGIKKNTILNQDFIHYFNSDDKEIGYFIKPLNKAILFSELREWSGEIKKEHKLSSIKNLETLVYTSHI